MSESPNRNTILLNSFRTMLYGKARDKGLAMLNDLIRRNSIQCGNQQRCFMYRGELIGAGNYNLKSERLPRPVNRLIGELHPEMDKITKDYHTRKDELPLVEGYFHRVFIKGNTLNDFLRLIPSSLHYPINALADFFPSATDLDDDVIQQFLTDNDEYLKLIKRRLALNLLL